MASDRSQPVKSFKVKGTSGNVYLIEEIDDAYAEATQGAARSTPRRPAYRVASSHMQVNYDARDDTFRIFGSDEVLRRI